jgi:uncharacterized protein YggL (DUF469 family)
LYSTEQIRKYVEQLYLLLPKSKQWGRIFQVPQNLYVKIADRYPEMDSPYSGNPSSAPVNPNTTLLGRVLSIFAIQMLRVDERIVNLPTEMISSTAEENLEEWETIYRLEDTSGTVAERQARIQRILDTQQTPRTFEFLKSLATYYGAAITIENALDIYNGDPLNFDGNDYDPWSGQIGVGEIGACTVGSWNWGGFCNITIVNKGSFETNDDLIERFMREIHAGTMVEWSTTGGNIIQTTSATDTITQTTDAIDTITQV